jgi:hypothetical protein
MLTYSHKTTLIDLVHKSHFDILLDEKKIYRSWRSDIHDETETRESLAGHLPKRLSG